MALDVSVRCLMHFGLLWTVVVSSGLTCGLVIRVQLSFRCYKLVMAICGLIVPFQNSQRCFCIVLASFIWLFMVL